MWLEYIKTLQKCGKNIKNACKSVIKFDINYAKVLFNTIKGADIMNRFIIDKLINWKNSKDSYILEIVLV